MYIGVRRHTFACVLVGNARCMHETIAMAMAMAMALGRGAINPAYFYYVHNVYVGVVVVLLL